MLVGVGVLVGVDVDVCSGVSVVTMVGVRVSVGVGSRVRRDAIPVNCGLALPQAYADIEQHEQTRQYAKMMTA